MKRNEPSPRPTAEGKPSIRTRKAYRKPVLKHMGVLKSVVGSDPSWAPPPSPPGTWGN
jgi:hypothetical protein